MNDITVFHSKEFGDMSTITQKGQPWFIGKEVASILGYSNVRDALSKHVDDEDKGVAKRDTPGGAQKTIGVLKEENKKLETANEAMKPKALFADAYASTKDGILVGAMAKMLRQNGIEIGQKRLFRFLRENGYLMKFGTEKNMPTQRSMDRGWFRIKARTITTPDGSSRSTRTVLVTGKGQQYFVNLFLKEEPTLM